VYSIIGFDFSESLEIFEVDGIRSGRSYEIEDGKTIEDKLRLSLSRELDILFAKAGDSFVCFDRFFSRYMELAVVNGKPVLYDLFDYLEDNHHIKNARLMGDKSRISFRGGNVEIQRGIETEVLGPPENVILLTSYPKFCERNLLEALTPDRVVNTFHLEKILVDKRLTYTFLSDSAAKNLVIPFCWYEGNLTIEVLEFASKTLGGNRLVAKPNLGMQGAGSFSYAMSLDVAILNKKIAESNLEIEAKANRGEKFDNRWVFQLFVGQSPYKTIRAITLGSTLVTAYQRESPGSDIVKTGTEVNTKLSKELLMSVTDAATNLSRIIHESQSRYFELNNLSLAYKL
jgi:hypothetical protein